MWAKCLSKFFVPHLRPNHWYTNRARLDRLGDYRSAGKKSSEAKYKVQPVMGLYQKYVQAAMHRRLNLCNNQEMSFINHQKCIRYHSPAYAPLKYLGVKMGDQWLHPSSRLLHRCWTADNQLSANDRGTPPYHGIAPCQWEMTVH